MREIDRFYFTVKIIIFLSGKRKSPQWEISSKKSRTNSKVTIVTCDRNCSSLHYIVNHRRFEGHLFLSGLVSVTLSSRRSLGTVPLTDNTTITTLGSVIIPVIEIIITPPYTRYP